MRYSIDKVMSISSLTTPQNTSAIPKKGWGLLLFIAMIYTALRTYHLGYLALWNDEVFSANVAKMSWPNMFQAVISDVVHPPLFYILLKLWIAIGGSSVLWMRTLPFLISIITLVPLLLFCREWQLTNAETGIAFSLITFNELLIHYSQELRMYSLLVALSLLSLWLFSKWLHTGVGLLWLTLVNLLLAYTHYYGALFVFTEVLFMIWWGRRHRNWSTATTFLLSASVVGVCFLPWLYLVGEAARAKHGLYENLKFFSRPTAREIVWFYEELKGQPPIHHTALLGLALFLIPLTVCLFLPSHRRPLAQQLFLFGFFPTAVSVVASYVLPHPVFSPRYLITVAVPCLILVAVGIMAMNGAARRAFAVILVSWSAVSGTWFALLPDRKVPWDRLAGQLLVEPAPIYTYELHEHTPLDFYGAKNTMLPSPEQITNVSQREFYFVYRTSTWRGDDPATMLGLRGFSVVARFEAHDIHEQIIAIRCVSDSSSPPHSSTDNLPTSHSREVCPHRTAIILAKRIFYLRCLASSFASGGEVAFPSSS